MEKTNKKIPTTEELNACIRGCLKTIVNGSEFA